MRRCVSSWGGPDSSLLSASEDQVSRAVIQREFAGAATFATKDSKAVVENVRIIFFSSSAFAACSIQGNAKSSGSVRYTELMAISQLGSSARSIDLATAASSSSFREERSPVGIVGCFANRSARYQAQWVASSWWASRRTMGVVRRIASDCVLVWLARRQSAARSAGSRCEGFFGSIKQVSSKARQPEQTGSGDVAGCGAATSETSETSEAFSR